MADYLKLFIDKRLTPTEAHHLEYIRGRLAAMKAEDDKAYSEYSKHYGVDLEVTVKETPALDGQEPPKKRGRRPKIQEPIAADSIPLSA